MRRGGVLAGHPLHRLLAALELRRIVANEENVALLLRRAERRHNADIRAATIRQIAEGGYDPRHVADVADMLLLAGHRVNDDGALQSDLKLYGRARRQVFLPQLLAVDDDAGPGLGVIGLIADDQLYRLALLADKDTGVIRDSVRGVARRLGARRLNTLQDHIAALEAAGEVEAGRCPAGAAVAVTGRGSRAGVGGSDRSGHARCRKHRGENRGWGL